MTTPRNPDSIYKVRIGKDELKRLTPYIKELASGMTHQQIVDTLDNRVAINTVQKIARGIVNVNRDRSTESSLEADQRTQNRKAALARKLRDKHGIKSKKNPNGITRASINKTIVKKYGTQFSPTTLNKILKNDDYVPVARRRLLRSKGETFGKAAWKELTKAREAVDNGTADHFQKRLVSKHEAEGLKERRDNLSEGFMSKVVRVVGIFPF